MKVTVVTAVYNGVPWLRDSLESILNQTFTDFELVIVNDGSTDGTPAILKKYAKKDRRIRVLENPVNLGVSKARNLALKLAGGKFIAIHDADDLSLPERLRLQTSYLEDHPEIGAICAYADWVDEDDKLIWKWRPPLDHERLRAYLLICDYLCHPTLFFRKNLLEKLGGYSENRFVGEDYDFWWRLSSITQLGVLPETIVKYRSHRESLSSLYRKELFQSSSEISTMAVGECLKENRLDVDAYKKFWFDFNGIRQRLDGALEGLPGPLSVTDIRRLEPFWKLLGDMPRCREIWGGKLLVRSYYFLTHGQREEGLELFRALIRHVRVLTPGNIWYFTKAALRPYLPESAKRLYRLSLQLVRSPFKKPPA